jgi:hypothetical protein
VLALTVSSEPAEVLRRLAEANQSSLSELVVDAVECALEQGSQPVRPLPAGSARIRVRLDEDTLAAVRDEAADFDVSISAYVRSALAGYLVMLEVLGGGEPDWSDVPKENEVDYDDEEAEEDKNEADDERDEDDPVPPTRASVSEPASRVNRVRRSRTGHVTAVSGCLHLTRNKPDESGYVSCSECGRYASVVPPSSPEFAHLIQRALAHPPASAGPVLLRCGHLADWPLPARCYRCGRRARRADLV